MIKGFTYDFLSPPFVTHHLTLPPLHTIIMSSTLFADNIIASGDITVGDSGNNNLILNQASGNVTIGVTDQVDVTANLPDLGGSDDDFVLRTLAQTLTNKTIGDSADDTKQVAFDVSMATAATSTSLDFCQTANRNIKFPDASGTIALNPIGGTPNALVKINATGDGFDETMMISAAGTDIVGVTAISNGAAADISIGDAGQSLNILGSASVAEDLSVTGNAVINGDLTVNGTTTSLNTQNVTVEDNNLLLSSNYTTTSGRDGGLAVNYLPISTTTVAGAGFTATTVEVTSAASFLIGDFIIVSGAADASNNGLFEIGAIAGNVLTINAASTFMTLVNSSFVADATVAGDVTHVNISVIQSSTAGDWQVGKGNSGASPAPVGRTLLSFTDLSTAGTTDWIEIDLANVTGMQSETLSAYIAGSTTTVEVVLSGRDDAGEYYGGKLIRVFGDDGATNPSALGAGTKDVSASSALSWASGNLANVSNINASGANIVLDLESDVSDTDWKIIYRLTIAQA